MNRATFDSRFRATMQNTSGYTQAQLDAINDQVYDYVAELDADDVTTKSTVDHAFERAFDGD